MSVTVAAVVAVLRPNGLGLDLDARTKEGLLLAMVYLTLPVSAAYLIIGMFSFRGSALAKSSFRRPQPDDSPLLSGMTAPLAAVNAGVFRLIVLDIRRVTQVPAAGMPGASAQYPREALRGVTPDVSKLWWAVPLAVLLSLPQWMVAGFFWCGISGCSGGGFGVATGTEWVAVILSGVNGAILAVAVRAVRWLYPTRKRALVALAAGTLFALVGAVVTHG